MGLPIASQIALQIARAHGGEVALRNRVQAFICLMASQRKRALITNTRNLVF